MSSCARREAPMAEEVEFVRGNDRISQLAQRPDIADGVTHVRAQMAEADRTYAMGLAALRQAAELTQAELARRLGVTQAAISRIERPTTCSCPPSTTTSQPSPAAPASSSPSPTATRQPSTSHNSHNALVVTGLVGQCTGLLVRGRRGASCASASSSRATSAAL